MSSPPPHRTECLYSDSLDDFPATGSLHEQLLWLKDNVPHSLLATVIAALVREALSDGEFATLEERACELERIHAAFKTAPGDFAAWADVDPFKGLISGLPRPLCMADLLKRAKSISATFHKYTPERIASPIAIRACADSAVSNIITSFTRLGLPYADCITLAADITNVAPDVNADLKASFETLRGFVNQSKSPLARMAFDLMETFASSRVYIVESPTGDGGYAGSGMLVFPTAPFMFGAMRVESILGV